MCGNIIQLEECSTTYKRLKITTELQQVGTPTPTQSHCAVICLRWDKENQRGMIETHKQGRTNKTHEQVGGHTKSTNREQNGTVRGGGGIHITLYRVKFPRIPWFYLAKKP